MSSTAQFRSVVTQSLLACGGTISKQTLLSHTLAELRWVTAASFDEMINNLCSLGVVAMRLHQGVQVVRIVPPQEPTAVVMSQQPLSAAASVAVPHATTTMSSDNNCNTHKSQSNTTIATSTTASSAVVATAAPDVTLTTTKRRDREEGSNTEGAEYVGSEAVMRLYAQLKSPISVPPPLLVKDGKPAPRNFKDENALRVLVLLPPPRAKKISEKRVEK